MRWTTFGCLLICLTIASATSSFAEESRWRTVTGGRWDTLTATRGFNNQIVAVWFEAPVLPEHRMTLRRTYGELAEEMSTGRYRYSINCTSKVFATQEAMWLNSRSVPVVGQHKVPPTQLIWYSIPPETVVEALAGDVCVKVK